MVGTLDQKKLSDAQRQLLRLIISQGETTRNAMVEQSGFSLLTVTKSVTTLIEEGLLISDGVLTGGMGRRQNLIKPNPDYRYTLCVDIGFSSLKLGVVQFNGVIKESCIIPAREYPVADGIPYDEMLEALHAYLNKHGKENFLGMAISISGMVDIERGTVLFCPNIGGFNNRKFALELSREFDLPVQLDTSARYMAMAEMFFGGGRNIKDQMYISLGSGSIAAGIIVNGKSLQGAHGFAGEIGHIPVQNPKSDAVLSRCSCGGIGCLELYASMAMVVQKLHAQLLKYNGYSPAKTLMGHNRLTPELLAQAYRQGDAIVTDTINDVAGYVGDIVSTAINLNNPELVTFGGGFVWHLPELVGLIEKKIRDTCLVPLRSRLTIQSSSIDENAPLMGGAMQIIGQHLGFIEL